jgi:hypothetical protein
MADVLSHQIVAGDGDQMSFSYKPQAMENARHAQGRHGGFARARVARERHV